MMVMMSPQMLLLARVKIAITPAAVRTMVAGGTCSTRFSYVIAEG